MECKMEIELRARRAFEVITTEIINITMLSR